MLDILTSDDLQKQLKISRSTLHRLRTKHGLPYIKFSGKIFFHQKDVDRFLQEHSSHPFQKNEVNDNK